MKVQFRYENKTDETLFLTSNDVIFDDVHVNLGVMAFFEELAPNSGGVITAYFQDIEDKGYIVPPLKETLYMNVEFIEEDTLDVRAQYDVDVAL